MVCAHAFVIEVFIQRTKVSAAASSLALYLDVLVVLLLLMVPYCIYGNKLPWVRTCVQALMCSCSAPLTFSETKLYCALRQGMEPFHLCMRQYPCFSFALVLALLVLPVYVILLITLWEFAFLCCLLENKLTFDFWQFGWYHDLAPQWTHPELKSLLESNQLDEPFVFVSAGPKTNRGFTVVCIKK